MKKTMLILAATVAMGTAAIAQDTSTTAPQTTPDTSAPTAPATGTDTAAPQAAPDASMPAAPATTPDQSATPPATDGAGMTPPPSTGGMSTAMSQPTGDYPPCGKGVTDKCVQKGGMHKTMAHHKHKMMHKKK